MIPSFRDTMFLTSVETVEFERPAMSRSGVVRGMVV